MTPHRWSESFTWTPSPGLGGALAADQLAAFDRDGFIVLADAFDPATLAELESVLDHEAGAAEAFLDATGGRAFIAESGAIVFSPHLVTRHGQLRSFVSDALFADLCLDLVGPDVRLYWDQLVYKHPEKPRRFPWHQDNGYAFVEPQQYLTCWIAITDATEDNGCPWIVPGLHRNGTLAHRYVDPLGFECFADHPDALPVPVAAGSMVVFSSLTPHLTGPNTSDAVRKAYIVQYAPEGAVRLDGDPTSGPPTGRSPMSDPDRQFSVVLGGAHVSIP